jgi:hypothetical protein
MPQGFCCRGSVAPVKPLRSVDGAERNGPPLMTLSRPGTPRRRRAKLPARYAGIVMPLVLSVLMTCVISGISTAVSAGVTADLPAQWWRAWAVSWLVAFPTLIVVLPLVRRIVAALVDSPAK